MKGLTTTQRAALKLVVREPDNHKYGWGSGCTNMTMRALEKRGFVKCEFDRSKSCPGFPWSRWQPTDEGRAAVDRDSVR